MHCKLVNHLQERPNGEVVARIWIAMPQIRSDRRKVLASALPALLGVICVPVTCVAHHIEEASRQTHSVHFVFRTVLRPVQSSYPDAQQQQNSSPTKVVCAQGSLAGITPILTSPSCHLMWTSRLKQPIRCWMMALWV